MLFERACAAASAFKGSISSSSDPNFSGSELSRRPARNAIENARLTDARRTHRLSINDGKWDADLTIGLVGYSRSPLSSRIVCELCFCEVIYCGCLQYCWGVSITTLARVCHCLRAMLGPYLYCFCQVLCCFAGRLRVIYAEEYGYRGDFLGLFFAVRICYHRQVVASNVSVDMFGGFFSHFHNAKF